MSQANLQLWGVLADFLRQCDATVRYARALWLARVHRTRTQWNAHVAHHAYGFMRRSVVRCASRGRICSNLSCKRMPLGVLLRSRNDWQAKVVTER